MKKPQPAVVRPKRAGPILICQKCLKRSSDGKDIKRALKSLLRSKASAADRKKPRLVLTSCVGICPKRAVVVTNGSYLKRGEYLLLDLASIESVALVLMPVVSDDAAF